MRSLKERKVRNNFNRLRIASLVSALVISACGGGGGGGGTATPASDAPTPAPGPGQPTPAPVSPPEPPVTAPTPAPAAPGAAPAPGPAPALAAQVIAATSSTARGVAVLSSGPRVAVWSDAAGVHAQQFDASGALVQGAVLVAAVGTFSGVAPLPGGLYIVEFQTPEAVFAQVVSAEGGLVGAAVVVRTQEQETRELRLGVEERARPFLLLGGGGVIGFSDGSFAASYFVQHNATIPGDVPLELYVVKFDAARNLLPGVMARGGPFVDVERLPSNSIPIAPAPDDRLIIAASNHHSSNPFALNVTVTDSTLREAFVASLAQGEFLSQGPLRVAGLADGNFVALWTTDSREVRGEIFTPDPTSPTGARVIGGAPITFSFALPGANVTPLAGGGFVLTWSDALSGQARAYDSNGQPISGVIPIQPGDNSVAATPDGGFVVLAQVGLQLVAQPYAIAP
jgi:hypothetical protein